MDILFLKEKNSVKEKAMTRISMEEYETAIEEDQGWCIICCAFTRDMTEPDAEEYDCPVCGENGVMGAKQALLYKEIVIMS